MSGEWKCHDCDYVAADEGLARSHAIAKGHIGAFVRVGEKQNEPATSLSRTGSQEPIKTIPTETTNPKGQGVAEFSGFVSGGGRLVVDGLVNDLVEFHKGALPRGEVKVTVAQSAANPEKDTP